MLPFYYMEAIASHVKSSVERHKMRIKPFPLSLPENSSVILTHHKHLIFHIELVIVFLSFLIKLL